MSSDNELDYSQAMGVLEELMAPIFIVRAREQFVIFSNRQGVELTGFKSSELMAQKITDLIHPDDRERFSAFWKLMNQESACEDRFKLVRKSGRPVSTLFKMKLIENEELVLIVLQEMLS